MLIMATVIKTNKIRTCPQEKLTRFLLTEKKIEQMKNIYSQSDMIIKEQ